VRLAHAAAERLLGFDQVVELPGIGRIKLSPTKFGVVNGI
jgi:hypothetical protein